MEETKFCKECGEKIAAKAVICPKCGCQVEKIEDAHQQPQIVINNSNQNSNQNQNQNTNSVLNAMQGRMKNKWVALLLCAFGGWLGLHKFYENKAVLGVLYMFTFGLLGIGVVLDFISILGKPNPYFV